MHEFELGATATLDSPLSAGTRKVWMCFKCLTHGSSPIVISGDTPELGNWDLALALPTQLLPRPQGGFECVAQIELPMGHTVEYKFAKKGENGVRWEAGMNRRITVIPGLNSLDADFRD